MKVIWRGMSVAIVAGVLAGCSGEGGSGESVTTPDNPQAGLDALKNMPALQNPKDAAKAKALAKHAR